MKYKYKKAIHNINGEKREVFIMCQSGIYVMVRRKGCMPYIAHIKEIEEV